MKWIHKFLKGFIFAELGACALRVIVLYNDYLRHSERYVIYSAPWYTEIVIILILTAIAVMITAAIYFVVGHIVKKRSQGESGSTYKGYKIRKMTPQDNADMAAIVRYNLKKHNLDIPGTAYFDSCLDDLCAFYEGRDCCGYYVLTDKKGKLVGGIGFDKISSIPNGAELQKMYLADAAKGKTLSYFLIGFIEDRMRQAGITTAYLETHSNLQIAIHVYEKCGYKRIDRPAEVGHSTMDRFYIKEL